MKIQEAYEVLQDEKAMAAFNNLSKLSWNSSVASSLDHFSWLILKFQVNVSLDQVTNAVDHLSLVIFSLHIVIFQYNLRL